MNAVQIYPGPLARRSQKRYANSVLASSEIETGPETGKEALNELAI